MRVEKKTFAYRVPIGDYNYLQCTTTYERPLMTLQLQCLWRFFIPTIQDTAGRGFEMLKKHHKPCSCDVINRHLYVVVPLAVLENYGIYLSDFIPLSCWLTKEKKITPLKRIQKLSNTG